MNASQQVIEHTRKESWIQRLAIRRPFQKGSATLVDTNARERLPSFFVVGPPRTGTSWLHEVLRQRAVLPVSTKETRFFDTHFHRGLDWYLAHYPRPVDGHRVGEIAPTYFASVQARERIARLIPNARVVCVFRDPVERIVSLYRVKRAYGLIPWSFEEAMVRDPELLCTSKYSDNYRAWQNALGTGQVLATVYDDLRDDPQSFLHKIADFIGVPRIVLTPAQNHSVHASENFTHPRSYTRTRNAVRMADWLKARRFDKVVAAVRNSPLRQFLLGGGSPFTDLPSDLRTRLYDHFRPEVEELEKMLQRDLMAWKSASFQVRTRSNGVGMGNVGDPGTAQGASA